MALVEYASESGHWYTRDGKPMYTVVGKNGNERPTTLRDARKLNLLPSVTSITKLAAAPALERWKAEQLLLAALTLPRDPSFPESETEWIQRVWKDSQEQGIKAAARGTSIHGAIEMVLRGERALVAPELLPFADAALDVVHKTFPGVEWEVERSFASPKGYGGKVDLFARSGVLIDFKSKDSLTNVKCYDEHFMQAAAYAHGLDLPFTTECANIFVTRKLPAEALIIRHDQEDTSRGWQQFLALLAFFQAKTGLF